MRVAPATIVLDWFQTRPLMKRSHGRPRWWALAVLATVPTITLASAGVEGYPYSDALRRHGQASWDRATLERFLAAPQQFAPGVNMTFGGVPRAEDRAVVLDFLATLTPEGLLADDEPAPPAAGETRGSM